MMERAWSKDRAQVPAMLFLAKGLTFQPVCFIHSQVEVRTHISQGPVNLDSRVGRGLVMEQLMGGVVWEIALLQRKPQVYTSRQIILEVMEQRDSQIKVKEKLKSHI